MTKVRKAVIPAAGLGTRFHPATKSQPKEMVPVIDKPTIQYVVEEAVGAGITDILVITGRGKRAIEDHFDRNFELEFYLEQGKKHDELEEVQAISEMAGMHYIRQRDPLGLGHAVSVARQHVGGEPFAVMLGDDIMVDDAHLLRSIIEKPKPEDAPSNLAVIGRYVFTPEIFDALDRITPGAGGELQLTDAIGLLLQTQTVFGYTFETGRYDIGKKIDFLRATVELALDRPDLGDEFKAFLADLV